MITETGEVTSCVQHYDDNDNQNDIKQNVFEGGASEAGSLEAKPACH
jgi:hypothetical protein